jgi:hypothetical protein
MAPPTASPTPRTALPVASTTFPANPKVPSMVPLIAAETGVSISGITFFYSLFLVSALQDEPSTNQRKDLFHMVSSFQSQLSNICDAEPKQRSYYSSSEASCDSAPHKKIFEIR